MIATLEAILYWLEAVVYWLVASVTAAFIGLAIVMPERVERTMMDIPTRIVTAVAEANLVASPSHAEPAAPLY
jgi:Flp pilus assembly protein protease CpaA